MVMAIWLIALSVNRHLPRRLIYVVDRRTVVDQATNLASLLRKKAPKTLPEIKNLAISTLRGQLADNREWTRDPSRAAVIIGTVDLIGSALLFSGYRSGYKRRPLEAGLLGQDSLLVLDEAHLSKPFEKLVKSIGADGPFQKDRQGKPHGTPMKVIRMSATSGGSKADNVFQLDTDSKSPTYDLKPDPDPSSGEERNQTIMRFTAKKCLTVERDVDKKELNKTLCRRAIELAQSDSLKGKRIVVFIRTPSVAKAIAEMIRAHEIKDVDTNGKRSRIAKSRPYADSVEILTGTMRGLERDELVEKPILKRFLDGKVDPTDPANQEPVFLISTSAGEVGFDLNADHMVCDAAPFDSMIQRQGRVSGQPLGKAATTRDPKSLRGYRHEFGSLLRIHHPDPHATNCSPPPDRETRDISLHMIAAHHGFGRPHFDNPRARDFQTKHCEAIHTDAIRRFARLQRKYGWWRLAWLENLLRCADALASADADDDAEDSEGGYS